MPGTLRGVLSETFTKNKAHKDFLHLLLQCLTFNVACRPDFVALAGGLLIILPDLLFFNDYSQAIADSYATKPTFVYVLASVTYGGVIEEVMLRLFCMSLIVFVLHKLFNRKNSASTQIILVVSNIVCALLFAVGHLPATFLLIGNAPLVIVRCFALNGGLGFLFGWLYHKYGLRYSMIAHAGCHIVSKLIWILFI